MDARFGVFAAPLARAIALSAIAVAVAAAAAAVAPTIVLNGRCYNDRDCAAVPHAECVYPGSCQCGKGYGPLNSTACGKLIGDQCVDTCDALNSICLWKGLCGCPEGMRHNSNYTFCYSPPERLQDLCDVNSECSFLGPAGQCEDGRCVCQQFSACRNTFARARPHGAPCEVRGDCPTTRGAGDAASEQPSTEPPVAATAAVAALGRPPDAGAATSMISTSMMILFLVITIVA